ncbi:hypothetical protein HG530_013887 [Fusarium avenaceum]|nr:hypothetical protein HG530_013887 [Fusarium avenaceum]
MIAIFQMKSSVWTFAPLRIIFQCVTVAHLSAAVLLCSPDSFTFPSLPGAELRAITAAPITHFTGYDGLQPEVLRMHPRGVNICNVTVSYTHPGHNDLVSAQIWLPLEAYNHRFIGLGGGGWVAGERSFDLASTLASHGYATGTTDAGYTHDHRKVATPPDSWVMENNGNLNYPLIINFAYRALHDLTVISRHIIGEAYHAPPKFSYWHGCSTGGRQGMTLASRYPDDYDGILAYCPAVNLPKLVFGIYWPQFVMNQMGSYPQACQFEAITAAALYACDALDGLEDGILARDDLCNFDPESVVRKEFDCDGSPSKISRAAVDVVKAMIQGPVDTNGDQLFPGQIFSSSFVGPLSIANTFCEGGNCTRGVPFPIATDWFRIFLNKNASYDPSLMSHSEFVKLYRQSVREWEGLFIGSNPDLRQFYEKGKKMITWHATSDELIPIKGTRQYYDAIVEADRLDGITTQDYYRYFEVPGAIHCRSRDGAFYPLDALNTLRMWVEDGVKPEELNAVVVKDGKEEAQVPLCLYPKKPRWTKSGFVCEVSNEGASHDKEIAKDEL